MPISPPIGKDKSGTLVVSMSTKRAYPECETKAAYRTTYEFCREARAEHSDWEYSRLRSARWRRERRYLVLVRKPGPMTSVAGGGVWLHPAEQQRPDRQAAFGFMKQADLPRNRTISLDIIPGWERQDRDQEQDDEGGYAWRRGAKELPSTYSEVATIVLVGKRAQRAKPLVESLGLKIFVSAHPSYGTRFHPFGRGRALRPTAADDRGRPKR